MSALNILLVLAAGLFLAGLFGIAARRTILMQLIALEVMLAGPALGFIAAGTHHGSIEGSAMFLLVLGLAAAEVALGLAIYLHMRRATGGDSDVARGLRG